MKVEFIPLKNTTKTARCQCTRCLEKLEQASSLEDDGAPRPGDWTVCLYCGHAMVFRPDMTALDPTIDETLELMRDADASRQVKDLQAKFRAINMSGGRAFAFRNKGLL